MIADKKWPAGGLEELQGCVESCFEWARQVGTDGIDAVSAQDYTRFMQVMIAAMYVFFPQGRPQGFSDMRYRQMEQVRSTSNDDNVTTALTQVFKTSAIYGHQPVTVPKVTLMYICVCVFIELTLNCFKYIESEFSRKDIP